MCLWIFSLLLILSNAQREVTVDTSFCPSYYGSSSPKKKFIAERAKEEYEPMGFDFPDEDLMVVLQIEEEESPKEDGWKMYFDRASNALGRGVWTVLISPEGNHCPFTAKLSFDCTNNVAEYEACVMGLQEIGRASCRERV